VHRRRTPPSVLSPGRSTGLSPGPSAGRRTRRTRRTRPVRAAAALLVAAGLALVAGACGASGSDGAPITSDQLPSATSTLRLGTASRDGLTLSGVTVRLTGSGGDGRVYLTARNSGPVEDALVAVSTVGGSGSLLVGDLVRPTPGGTLPVPARGSVTVGPSQPGVTIQVTSPSALVGQTMPVTFTFAHAGPITVFSQITG